MFRRTKKQLPFRKLNPDSPFTQSVASSVYRLNYSGSRLTASAVLTDMMLEIHRKVRDLKYVSLLIKSLIECSYCLYSEIILDTARFLKLWHVYRYV
jgi:hypothetical protein